MRNERRRQSKPDVADGRMFNGSVRTLQINDNTYIYVYWGGVLGLV
jgi:hypothetical protein